MGINYSLYIGIIIFVLLLFMNGFHKSFVLCNNTTFSNCAYLLKHNNKELLVLSYHNVGLRLRTLGMISLTVTKTRILKRFFSSTGMCLRQPSQFWKQFGKEIHFGGKQIIFNLTWYFYNQTTPYEGLNLILLYHFIL